MIETWNPNRNWTAQGYAEAAQLELIDDAFCDIIQDQRKYLTPEVERSLSKAIDRLREWRVRNGYMI